MRAEWVRVEDRLPTEEGLYLVAIEWVRGENRERRVEASGFVLLESGRRYWLREDRWTPWETESKVYPWRVTHWAPLPEGPEEGVAEDTVAEDAVAEDTA